MPDHSNFHIIAADSEWNINTKGQKSEQIARWLRSHYEKKTSDKKRMESVRKKAEGQPVYETNGVIYLIP